VRAIAAVPDHLPAPEAEMPDDLARDWPELADAELVDWEPADAELVDWEPAVLAADPSAARRRKEAAQQDARVERWDEHAGTAALAGRDLPQRRSWPPTRTSPPWPGS
jgi:hypothetical protein